VAAGDVNGALQGGVSRIVRGAAARLRSARLSPLRGRHAPVAEAFDVWEMERLEEDAADGADESAARPRKRLRRVVRAPTASEDEGL